MKYTCLAFEVILSFVIIPFVLTVHNRTSNNIISMFKSSNNRSMQENIAILEDSISKVGGTLCSFLAIKSNQYKVPRKIFAQCKHATCQWDSWQHAISFPQSNIPKRIVLSYGHNGLGNQLWEHTVAFMIAESLGARLLIAPVPSNLCPDHLYGNSLECFPPHTLEGMSAMKKLLPDNFEYELLSNNSIEHKLCEAENFFIADRPRDWRDANYKKHFLANIVDILTDTKPRCLKILGYFQDLPLCADDAQRLWTPRMISNYTEENRPGKDDISIYLRCIRHYHFNDVFFYESILNHTTFKRVWLFQAPECNGFRPAIPVLNLLRNRFNATRWPSVTGGDSTAALLHDLSGLVLSTKLILPASSWAFWGGFLSNGTEIHVNAPPHHPVMPDGPQYIYHNDKTKQFFGRYNTSTGRIEFPNKL